MTRALVVHLDPAIAAARGGRALRARLRGRALPRSGPRACPVLRGHGCPRAERADVLVYDLASLRSRGGSPRGRRGAARLYADKPIVVVVR